MAIEQQISELITNIAALNQTMGSLANALAGIANTAEREAVSAFVDPPTVSAAVEETRTVVVEVATPAPTPAAVVNPESLAPITFDEVKSAVMALATRDRNKAVALFAKYKVSKVSDLKPEQYEAVLNDAEADIP
jgi:hypothetical protein